MKILVGWAKFTLETAKEFEIGYAPVDGFALLNFYRLKNSLKLPSKNQDFSGKEKQKQ